MKFTLRMKFTKVLAFLLLGIMASPSHAELFGLGNGRTANMDNMANMSVEGGVNFGGDINVFGGRFNYKLSPDMVLYGDLGQASYFDDLKGFVYGFGVYYQLRNVQLLENTDFAVKGSYHGGTLEVSGCDDAVDDFFGFFSDAFCEYDASEIAIEGLISGDQLGDSNMAWYGSAGIHILDESNEIGFGGGVVGDLAFGNWYAGAEFVDEIYFTAGIRYNLN